MRKLAYWKGRKIDIIECMDATTPLCSYWWMLRKAYDFADGKIKQIEEETGIVKIKER